MAGENASFYDIDVIADYCILLSTIILLKMFYFAVCPMNYFTALK